MRLLQIVILCTIVFVTSACASRVSSTQPATEITNPASMNCIHTGGKLTFKHTFQGEFGMCQLPSGKVCEEWALFRGECL